MEEKRAEARLLCADLVEVRWKDKSGRSHSITALLEDISPSGACLQLENPLALGTHLRIEHATAAFEGITRYCVYREIGYFIGVQFGPESRWSRGKFRPQHLLDLQRLVHKSAQKAVRRK